MAQTSTITRGPSEGDDGGARITPRRPLPGGRAVVGAFLVVLAAVGTFGAYLQATAAPSTSYLVASEPLEVGRLVSADDLSELFEAVAIDLPEQQAARTVRADQRGQLDGTVVLAPVAAGDLLLRSAVEPVGSAEPGVQLSLSLPTDRAIGGSVAVGERVDLIGTFATDDGQRRTAVVARQVTIVSRPASSDGLAGGRVVLTVQVPDLATAQAVQHAVDVGEVAILRGADADAPDPAPADGFGRAAPASEGLDAPDAGRDGGS